MADLDRLDKYLWSDDSPEGCMMLSDLDGFLHGVICSPVAIAAGEWVPIALGCPVDAVPSWVCSEIGLRYGEILQGLLAQPPVVEPALWRASEGNAVAMDWCEGFMQAVTLRSKEWLPLSASRKHSYVLIPILVHVFDDNGNSVVGIRQDEIDATLDQAVEAIPDAIAGIFQFWRKEWDSGTSSGWFVN